MPASSADNITVAAAPTLAVDVKQAAEILHASESDVRRWVADGLLPAVKYPSNRRPGEASRRVLVAVSDLHEFVIRHRDTAPAPNAALSDAAVRRWREKERTDLEEVKKS